MASLLLSLAEMSFARVPAHVEKARRDACTTLHTQHAKNVFHKLPGGVSTTHPMAVCLGKGAGRFAWRAVRWGQVVAMNYAVQVQMVSLETSCLLVSSALVAHMSRTCPKQAWTVSQVALGGLALDRTICHCCLFC